MSSAPDSDKPVRAGSRQQSAVGVEGGTRRGLGRGLELLMGGFDPAATELLELQQGTVADAPLCFTCGTKMRPAGSCYVCEGCGSTSGCS